jgi:hypothetical protein
MRIHHLIATFLEQKIGLIYAPEKREEGREEGQEGRGGRGGRGVLISHRSHFLSN